MLTVSIVLSILAAFIVAATWFYYRRTKRLLRRSREYMQRSVDDAFLRIENRLVRDLPQWNSKSETPTVWAMIFTYNRRELSLRTIHSLRKYEPNLPLLAIDNGSTDGTREALLALLEQGLINKILFNQHDEVPQWQKSFAINQALRFLALEQPSHVAWMDDDLLFQRPFVEDAIYALEHLTHERVKVISMTDDAVEERNHPTIKTIEVSLPGGSRTVKIRSTFNGQLNFFASDFFREFGAPPIGEGIRNFGCEDWYYSRRLQSMDYRAAVFEAAAHAGAIHSKREELERAMMRE